MLLTTGCTYSDTPLQNTPVSIHTATGTITFYDRNFQEVGGPYLVTIDNVVYRIPFNDPIHNNVENIGSNVEFTYKEMYNTKGDCVRVLLQMRILPKPCNGCSTSCNWCTPTPIPEPTKCGCDL